MFLALAGMKQTESNGPAQKQDRDSSPLLS